MSVSRDVNYSGLFKLKTHPWGECVKWYGLKPYHPIITSDSDSWSCKPTKLLTSSIDVILKWLSWIIHKIASKYVYIKNCPVVFSKDVQNLFWLWRSVPYPCEALSVIEKLKIRAFHGLVYKKCGDLSEITWYNRWTCVCDKQCEWIWPIKKTSIRASTGLIWQYI